MDDTKIIFNIIQKSVPNDHPSVYLYISGNRLTKQKAVNNIVKLFDGILYPPYSIGHVRTVVKTILKVKSDQHKRGEIEITKIY